MSFACVETISKGRKMTTENNVKNAIRAEKLCQAKEKHGKPFAYEAGSNWKPRQVPLLTEWLQGRGREEAK